MNGQGDVLEREARARRAILRRASLFTFGMLAFTLTVAVGGSALIALVLSAASDLPFRKTWLVLTAVVLAPPLVRIAFNALRGRT